ncbi:unnamed protein product, partial [Mesorhabditis spiculigera]
MESPPFTAFRAAILIDSHIVIDTLSVLFNGTLLYLIIFCTAKSFRSYSVILGCSTFTEFLLALAAGFTLTRVLAVENTLGYQFHGLCRKFSAQICMDAHSVIMHCYSYAQIMLPLSFWYRHRVLTVGPVKPARLAVYCLIAYIPAFLVLVGFASGTSPPEVIYKIIATKKNSSLWPDDPEIAAIIGYEDMTSPYNLVITMWICTPIAPGYVISIFYRCRILRKLHAHSSMSPKTLRAQKNLVKALTLQSVTPLLTMSLSTGFLWMQYRLPGHVHLFFLEEYAFILVALTSMINPCIIIYYVLPYRKRVQRLLFFWKRKNDPKSKIYGETALSHTRDSNLQTTQELF